MPYEIIPEDKAATEKRLMIAFDDIVNIMAKSFGQTMNTHIYSPCEILSALDGIPKMDAVEVVRCKDCISAAGNDVKGYMCQNQLCPCYQRDVPEGFSCICGERRAKYEQNEN